MTYQLIGSGNMAWLIASRMEQAGHTCTGAWARNGAALDDLCATFNLARLNTLSEIGDDADACILAVADSAIPELARALSFERCTLIHTAGSVALDALTAQSRLSGVVWPVYSIRKASLPASRDFPALVEANTVEAGTVVRSVANAICDQAYEADSSQRQWMHLAAVISNNFVNHLLGVAADISAGQGLPAGLLQPLIAQTVAASAQTHPSLLQTGPARRHDHNTMERHLQLLSDRPDWQIIYQTLSKAIADRYPLPARD